MMITVFMSYKKKSKFENNISLQHLIFGYNLFYKEYFHLNYFLTILTFAIYKCYHVSEQNTKKIDVYLLFKNNEFQRKMKENIILGMNSLFKNILNKL